MNKTTNTNTYIIIYNNNIVLLLMVIIIIIKGISSRIHRGSIYSYLTGRLYDNL